MLESDQVNGVNATTLEESMEGSLVLTKGPAVCFYVSDRRQLHQEYSTRDVMEQLD